MCHTVNVKSSANGFEAETYIKLQLSYSELLLRNMSRNDYSRALSHELTTVQWYADQKVHH